MPETQQKVYLEKSRRLLEQLFRHIYFFKIILFATICHVTFCYSIFNIARKIGINLISQVPYSLLNVAAPV